jgi:hypothetical protein
VKACNGIALPVPFLFASVSGAICNLIKLQGLSFNVTDTGSEILILFYILLTVHIDMCV